MRNKSALILGASGLVGKDLLKILINSSEYNKITLLVRKKIDISNCKVHQEIIDFDNLENYSSFFNVDNVFCCLGTTMKIAKTKEKFQRVDLDYPLISAKITKQIGKGNFYVVSAMGADENSRIFYNKIKGKLERQLKDMQLNTLHIFKPSMLSGNRTEFRLSEKISLSLSKSLPFLFIGNLKKYKPIETKDVALAMYLASLSETNGTYIHESDQIYKLANSK